MSQNPYPRDTKNWTRWNVGLEDGSRGEARRGESDSYNEGWNVGIKHFRSDQQWIGPRPDLTPIRRAS